MWNPGFGGQPYPMGDYSYQQQGSFQSQSQGPPVTNEEPLDWELIKSIDPALLKNSNDLGPLQKFISDFIVADFETCPSRLLVHPLLVRMCQILQYGLLYMSDVQKQYIRKIEGLEKDYKSQNDKMKKIYLSYKKADELLKKKSQDFERCPICRKKYKNIQYLDQHFAKHHPVYNEAWLEIRSLKPHVSVQPQPVEQTNEFKQLMRLYQDLKEEIRVERENNAIEKEKLQKEQQNLLLKQEQIFNERLLQERQKNDKFDQEKPHNSAPKQDEIFNKNQQQKKKHKQLFDTLSSAVDDLSQSWIAWEENSIIAPSPQQPKYTKERPNLEFMSRRPPTPIPDNIPHVSSPKSPSRIANKSRNTHMQDPLIPKKNDVTVRKSSAKVTINNKPKVAKEETDLRRNKHHSDDEDESESASTSISVKGIFSRNKASQQQQPQQLKPQNPSMPLQPKMDQYEQESSIVREMRTIIKQKAEEQKKKETEPKPPAIIVDNTPEEKKEPEINYTLTPIPGELQKAINHNQNLYVSNKPKIGRNSRLSRPFSRETRDEESSSESSHKPKQINLPPESVHKQAEQKQQQEKIQEKSPEKPKQIQEKPKPIQEKSPEKPKSIPEKPKQIPEKVAEKPKVEPKETPEKLQEIPNNEFVTKRNKPTNVENKKPSPVKKQDSPSPKKSPEKPKNVFDKKQSQSIIEPVEVSFETDKSYSSEGILSQDEEEISRRHEISQSPSKPQKIPEPLYEEKDQVVEEEAQPKFIYLDNKAKKQEIVEENVEEEEDWPFEFENNSTGPQDIPIQKHEEENVENEEKIDEEKSDEVEEKKEDKKNDTLLGDTFENEDDNEEEEEEFSYAEAVEHARKFIKREQEIPEEKIDSAIHNISRIVESKSSAFIDNPQQQKVVKDLLRAEIHENVDEYDQIINALRKEIENEFPFEENEESSNHTTSSKHETRHSKNNYEEIHEEEEEQAEEPKKSKVDVNEEFRKPIVLKEIPKPSVPPNNFNNFNRLQQQPQPQPVKQIEQPKPQVVQNDKPKQEVTEKPPQNRVPSTLRDSVDSSVPEKKPVDTKPGILSMEINKPRMAMNDVNEEKVESNVFEFDTDMDDDAQSDSIAFTRDQMTHPVNTNKKTPNSTMNLNKSHERSIHVNNEEEEYYYIYEEDEPETHVEKVKITEYSPQPQNSPPKQMNLSPPRVNTSSPPKPVEPQPQQEQELEYEYVYEEEEDVPQAAPPPKQQQSRPTKKLTPTFYDEPSFEDGEVTFNLTDHKTMDFSLNNTHRSKDGLSSTGGWD